MLIPALFVVQIALWPKGLSTGLVTHLHTNGTTPNESLAVLREVEKLGLSIPLAISFGLKGVFYVPKLGSPILSKDGQQYELFQPCKDHQAPYYDDPKELCGDASWTAPKKLPVSASNMAQKRAVTYLTEVTIATFACDGKQFNLKLDFTLAAYDVDFDSQTPCLELGFDVFSNRFSRVLLAKKVSNYLRTQYNDTTQNFNCQLQAVSFSFG
ncbi:hypothetical protein MRX96_007666 [Rhipicephalus microplus]